MKILFSVIIPVYNRESIIKSTIESVINQSFSNWELIVVDDGSTDNTRTSVLKFSINDERIKYIYQNNAERSVARNNGIKHASGDWICFLDSDDAFKDNHLEILHERIVNNQDRKKEISFYVTGQETFNTITQETTLVNNEIPKVNIPYFFASGSIVPGRVCIARQILELHQFDESIVIVEDADLWFRLSCHYECEFIDQASFQYHVHDNNSINLRNNVYKTRLDGLIKTFNKPEKKFLTKYQIQLILSNCYFGIHRFYIGRNEVSKARISLIKAIILYPRCRIKEKLYLLIFPKRI
tara:strand:+ start:341 stop:1231 length:891 start_codon:yes stop_codon:yes gene_type:complete